MDTPDWKTKVTAFDTRLTHIRNVSDRDSDLEERDKALITLLSDACQYVREAETSNYPDFDKLVGAIDDLLNEGVRFAYGEEIGTDFLESFAHASSAPLVKDQHVVPMGHEARQIVMKMLGSFGLRRDGDKGLPEPSPWRKARQPHASSTPLSRFRRPFPTSATAATPLAQTIYQARCEITTEQITNPMRVAISSSGSCLAIAGAGGYKNRDPALNFYRLDVPDEEVLSSGTFFVPGLREPASYLTLDEERKLIFVADPDRVKSYSWEKKGDRRRGYPVHTLRTDRHEGPISLLPNGRVIRAGRDSAVVWNIDALETHKKKKFIGKGKYQPDSWRDDADQIELSTGSLPDTTVTFPDSSPTIGAWHYHKPTGHFLCGSDVQRCQKYSCFSLDIESGGKIVKKFLGHGGEIIDLSTSDADPNVFLTACSDSAARLYDVRHPLPVLTIDAERLSESCDTGLLIHPDGIPWIRSESIKLWDLRARKVVYELSTGNTAVRDMAWDEHHSTLFAATECMYMNRMGSTHGYRQARKPDFTYCGDMGSETEEDETVTEEEKARANGERPRAPKREAEEDDEYDSFDDDEWCWPRSAYHGEDFFGRMYDAASHSLIRYKFKADANPDILPGSGYSSVRHGGLW